MEVVIKKITEVKSNPNNPRLIKDDKFNCLTCGAEFQSKKTCKTRTPKYCSKECYAKSLIKEKPIKIKIDRKGIKLTDAHKKALSDGRKNSEKCKGENLYNWKGGKETEAIRMKQSFYKRKLGLKLKMPLVFLKNVLEAQENKCFFCETYLIEYKAIEHLTPVSKGGDNQNYNLVYSCKSCNSQKRQNTLEEFAIKKNRFDWLNKFDTIYANAIS